MCLLYNLKAPLYVILKFPYVGLKSSTTGLHAPKVKKLFHFLIHLLITTFSMIIKQLIKLINLS